MPPWHCIARKENFFLICSLKRKWIKLPPFFKRTEALTVKGKKILRPPDEVTGTWKAYKNFHTHWKCQ